MGRSFPISNKRLLSAPAGRGLNGKKTTRAGQCREEPQGDSQVEKKCKIIEVKIFKIVAGLKKRLDSMKAEKVSELGGRSHQH